MEKNKPIAALNQETYLKSKKVSDEDALKQKYYGYDMRSDGPTNALGRLRTRTSTPQKSYLALFSSSFRAFVASVMTDEMIKVNLASVKAFFQTMKNATIGPSVSASVAAAPASLMGPFARNVGVSEGTYAALQAEVEDFRISQRQIVNAQNADFIGPFNAPELNAIRDGHYVCGPLSCEFHSHAQLRAKGIEFDKENDTFIYPEKLVSAFAREFGDASTNTSAPREVLVAFKTAATPDNTQEVHTPNTDYRPHGPQATLTPAPAYK